MNTDPKPCCKVTYQKWTKSLKSQKNTKQKSDSSHRFVFFGFSWYDKIVPLPKQAFTNLMFDDAAEIVVICWKVFRPDRKRICIKTRSDPDRTKQCFQLADCSAAWIQKGRIKRNITLFPGTKTQITKFSSAQMARKLSENSPEHRNMPKTGIFMRKSGQLAWEGWSSCDSQGTESLVPVGQDQVRTAEQEHVKSRRHGICTLTSKRRGAENAMNAIKM